MAVLTAVWANMPECPSQLCKLAEDAVGELEYHYLAVAIYLIVIVAVAMSVLKPDYFKTNYTNKLKRHGINLEGVNTVWWFSAGIVAFNATLHMAQLFFTELDYAPIKELGWLTWFWAVWGAVNVVLWVWFAHGYKQRAAKVDGFEKKKALLIIYFTPVAVLWAFDDTLSKNWDFFKINHGLEWALSNFQNWHGWVVIITVFLFLVVIVILILLEIFKQEAVHKRWWQFLVNILAPRALPITAVLGISLAGAGFFLFSGGGNGNVAELTPGQRPAPVQSTAPLQSATAPQKTASVQPVAPQQGVAPVQPTAQSSAQTQNATSAKGDDDHAVADQTAPMQPESKLAYNNRGLANIAKGDYDLAIADFSEAIRLDPKYALAYNNRCLARNNKGESDLALADCNEAIRLDPKLTSAYINRGIVSLYAGLLPMALADFNQWSQLDPKSAYAALWLNIVGKRGNLPNRLPAAAKQIDMTKWPAPIVRLYLGQFTADAVLTAADGSAANTKRGQVCEANFFTGEFMLQSGKKDEAAHLFRLAAADCPKDFVQYSAANAELKELGMSLISAAR
jgi:lipoprotein NlpI